MASGTFKPLSVQPQNGSNAGTEVFSVDDQGNLNTTGGVLITPMPTPAGTAGKLTLYSPDGEGVNSVDAVGNISILSGGAGTGGAMGWLNVKAFGAVGNGVADDTAAIQSALAAVSSNGNVVYFPHGIYKITASLTATVNGTRMMGDGWGSQIQYDGTVVSPAVKASGNIRLFMSDLRISQTNATNGTALDISQTNSGVYERLLLDGGGASGVTCANGIVANASTCHYNVIRDCRINYGGAASTGISFTGSSISNTVQDCHFIAHADDAASSGVYIAATHSIVLIRTDVESAAGNGVFLDTGAHNTTLLGCYNDTNGINLKISSLVQAPTVIGGAYEGGTTANIQDNGSINATIFNAWPNSGSTDYSRFTLPSITAPATPAAGTTTVYGSGNGLFALDSNGTTFPLVSGAQPGVAPDKVLGETERRLNVTSSAAGVSGTLYIGSVFLQAGTVVSKVGFISATGNATPTHWWTVLLDSGFVQRAHATDQLTTVIAATTWNNLTLTTPFTATYSGLYYLGVMIAVTGGMPALGCTQNPPIASVTSGTGALTPVAGGTSTSGLTAPGTDGTTTYAAPTTITNYFYFYCG